MKDASPAAPLVELAAQLGRQSDFARVTQSLLAGHGGALGGVWGASRALVAAALAEQSPGPIVVVLPHLADVERFRLDATLFTTAAMETFPAWESAPGERVVHDHVYGQPAPPMPRE